ncbi:MAG: thioredoxin-like domain-containing protein [Kiritimatiellia bacterium]|nr:thioredoxin-like domain-containing protein [Kiritimatiellia bacterium]
MKRILLLCVLLTLGSIPCRAAETRPPSTTSLFEQHLGGELINRAKQKKVTKDALDGKIVGIYFSAHWCPPCRAFTPKLVTAYKQIQKRHPNKFELVFVSLDRSEKAMFEYMKETQMPWLAVPFPVLKQLAPANTYQVQGIPTLLILDSKGTPITRNGRGDIQTKGAKAFDTWRTNANQPKQSN